MVKKRIGNLLQIMKNQYIYSIATKVIVVVVGFLNSVVLARYLGPELKGMATTVINYSNIFSIIITFGLQEAYPYFRNKRNKEKFISEYMSLVITIFIIYLIVLIIFTTICQLSFNAISCIIVTIIMGYSIIVNYIALVESPNKRNTAMTIMYMIDFAILIGAYIFIPQSYIIAIFLSSFLFLMQSVFYSIKLNFKYDFRLIKKEDVISYVKFGFFPMIALLLTTLNYRVDVIMLRASTEVTYAQIGIYSIGVSLAEKVFMIPNAVKEILLSKLANGKGKDEVCKIIKLCWPICLISTICIIILGKPFIYIFYGSEYADAYLTTIICVFGTIFMIFFKMISTYNIINGRQKINLVLLLISNVINILLNVFLIPLYGTNGAAVASDISYFICAILFVSYFCKTEKLKLKQVIFLKKEDMKFLKKIKGGN